MCLSVCLFFCLCIYICSHSHVNRHGSWCRYTVANSLAIRPRRKKTLFYGRDRPNFSFWQNFFFLISSKIFLTKIWKLWQKFLENKSKYFPNFFLQKISKFSRNFGVLGVIVLGPWIKKIKNRPTDRPYLAGPPLVKQGFFFSWPKPKSFFH